MKNIALLVLLFISCSSLAQECSTLWPYVYPEFKNGVLLKKGGGEMPGKFNVHVKDSRLHYIDNGIIKEAHNQDVLLVKVEGDIYMTINSQIMKVVGSEGRGFIATLILGDFDKLFNSSGAYGSSSNSSATNKLTSIEIGGINIVNHMELRQKIHDGEPLSLIYKYYIVTNNNVYPASKRGIMNNLSDEESKRFKLFLKNNKIRWSNVESLMKLLDFFNS